MNPGNAPMGPANLPMKCRLGRMDAQLLQMCRRDSEMEHRHAEMGLPTSQTTAGESRIACSDWQSDD